MFIVNRYFRENESMQHSAQFFDITTQTDGRLPQEVLNRVYAICDADGNKASIDYAMCQVVEDTGTVWRTEVIKPMPTIQS